MHTFKILTDAEEIERILLPVLEANGSEIPTIGAYVAAVEFDESGTVAAYQIVQQGVFLEGMWSRDHGAHFLRLWHMLETHLAALWRSLDGQGGGR